MRLITYLAFSGLVAAGLFAAESVMSQHNPNAPRKQMTALKINSSSPRLDGRLDDPAWQKAVWVSDFAQKEPVENGVPSGRTEVAIAYDDDAVYVGARMYCRNPEKLAMYLDRHDTQGPAEQFIVTFDSYHDHRTAYGFGVNVAGVRFDRYNSSDNEFIKDFSYNPVWEAATARDSVSWSCEMRIPFSQLRFHDQPEQTWGVQFNRWMPDKHEDVFWVVIPRSATGFASWFGELNGIENITPSRRLELMPYTTGNASVNPKPDPRDPLHHRTTVDNRIGGDLKMGLGPNLTLDATINPDFGQVEADPAVVNLSAYETSFEEKRPFFSEGNDLLHPEGPGYFYSRRIGAPPHGEVDGDFVKQPDYTTILGAAKVSGQVAKGTSIGLLTSVTGREQATSYRLLDGTTYKTTIEPPTVTGIGAVRREFGKNGSAVGMLLSVLTRNFDSDSTLRQILRRSAVAGNVDWNLRFKQGMYDIVGWAGFSRVKGDRAAMLATQRSSAHYFQRPDAQNYVSIDSARTTMTGFTAELRGGKRAGKHWLWEAGGFVESPDLELNDAGKLQAADKMYHWGNVTYRETTPKRWYHNCSMQFKWSSMWNFGGINKGIEFDLAASMTLKNYWEIKLGAAVAPSVLSDNLTRGGPLMRIPRNRGLEMGVGSSSTSSRRVGVSGEYYWDDFGGWYYGMSVTLASRIGNRLAVSLQPSWEEYRETQAWYGAEANGPASTHGTRYMFADLRSSVARVQMRVSYFFSPKLSLEVYAEPFAAAGKYLDIGELTAARSSDLRRYGTDGTTIEWQADSSKYRVTDGRYLFWLAGRDYGDRSFRSNVVLRWEFARGSAAYLVWQRNREAEREPGRAVRFGSLGDAFAAEGSDYAALKISYWIPVR